MQSYNVAVVGATGLVGRKMVQVLEERKFPVGVLIPMASSRSAGSILTFRGKSVKVEVLTKDSFQNRNIQLALFSAGASVSREFAPIAASCGTLVIDNSSAFRMEKGIPLVVPEVNPEKIFEHHGIIANPNCSTIQMVVVLKPLHDRYQIRRVVVSTYQSVTGAGKRGVDQLMDEVHEKKEQVKKFPYQISYNCLPQIDVFQADGYTKEEQKMISETRKIMGDDSIAVSPTCVRVPSLGGHSESVNIEFEQPFDVKEVRAILESSPGIVVQDEPEKSIYPMPIWAVEKDEVFVGRIRRDPSIKNGLNLWIVADNLRKGAATNAVQIAEVWSMRKSGVG
jgi:aspartate-semialdehyde dehydrogenase